MLPSVDISATKQIDVFETMSELFKIITYNHLTKSKKQGSDFSKKKKGAQIKLLLTYSLHNI